MNTSELLFVGVKGHVVALSRLDGAEVWKTKLAGGISFVGERFVTVLVDGDRIYAHSYGKLFCLDSETGSPLWTNDLAGLGYDIATLAVVGMSSPPLPAFAQYKRTRDAGEGGGGGGG